MCVAAKFCLFVLRDTVFCIEFSATDNTTVNPILVAIVTAQFTVPALIPTDEPRVSNFIYYFIKTLLFELTKCRTLQEFATCVSGGRFPIGARDKIVHTSINPHLIIFF